MILALADEIVSAGAGIEKVCDRLGIAKRTLTRWRAQGGGKDRRGERASPPSHKLSEEERATVLAIANQREFRNLSPRQIVPLLADEGRYVASESTFYRVLREAGELAHRGHARPARPRKPNAHIATSSNQVWSWDITYLPSPVRGAFYYLYLVVDIYSRKIVAAAVHAEESGALGAELVESAIAAEGADAKKLVLHSDNGAPMKASTMLTTLQRLGVIPSFSRPSVSDDNPFAEALFRTLKYRPGYPRKPFESLAAASAWVAAFVRWYNDEHLHSGIRYVTPSDRHAGRDVAILAQRHDVYRAARRRNPRRWSGSTRTWSPVGPVYLNPEKVTERVEPMALPLS